MVRAYVLLLSLAWIAQAAPPPGYDIGAVVRRAMSMGDFAQADAAVASYRKTVGATPDLIDAIAWLARGKLALKDYNKALAYAEESYKLAAGELKHRALDSEPRLPLALGASIEVQAQVLSAEGRRAEAVTFLRTELKTYYNTSIRARIQKNILLLSLEGKPAPAIDVAHWLGPKPVPLAALKGKPVLLFFWAHWCADCKGEVEIIARLMNTYAAKGLVLMGPTQHYGYIEGGLDATPAQEGAYIDAVRQRFYAAVPKMAVPVSEDNFQNYGASTTPTLVLVDRQGIVRMYHPGAMSYGELEARIRMII